MTPIVFLLKQRIYSDSKPLGSCFYDLNESARAPAKISNENLSRNVRFQVQSFYFKR